MDETFIIQWAEYIQQLLQHTISTDLHIQFSKEVPSNNVPITFLDSVVSLGPTNTLLAFL